MARVKSAYQRAVEFFYKHAGWSYNPKTETPRQGRLRGARALARAEQEASNHGVTFEWQWDESGCGGCDCGSHDCACSTGAEHETLGCVAKHATVRLCASLWGICGASREYRRVVEAELAQEAVAELDKAGVEALEQVG